jgi:opacity protein-like surface antigen
MKKIIFVGIAVLSFSVSTAQKVNFGVKGGLNVSTLTGDVEDLDPKIGFHLGGFAEIKLNEKFSIQPELMFSTQGAKAEYIDDFEGFAVNIEENLKINYIVLPIMAKYYVSEKFSIQAGPQIGFLISAKDEITASFEGESQSEEIDIKDETKSIDFGLNLGFGYNFTDKLFADARYNIGLSSIPDDSEVDVKNGVFQLSLGYRF